MTATARLDPLSISFALDSSYSILSTTKSNAITTTVMYVYLSLYRSCLHVSLAHYSTGTLICLVAKIIRNFLSFFAIERNGVGFTKFF